MSALGIHDLGLFIVAGLLLNITPGPDMLYIMGRSTVHGWRAGALAALGVAAGCFVHVGAAALGISALLTASATAFTAIKLVGAAYLVYVGLSLLGSDPRPGSDPGVGSDPKQVFGQGFLTCALNPKVALFFLAFLPQFIDADAPMKPAAFLVLGVIFNFNATLWNLFVAWSTARMGRALGGRASRWLQRCIGGFFVVLGVRLALAPRVAG